jgi:hypothetical protein
MAGVLAKLPESQRAQVEAIFNAAEAEGALEVIGTGALAQPEINRKLDEIAKQDRELKDKIDATNELYTKNDTWFRANKAALEEYPTLKSELDRLKAGGGDDDNPPKIDKLTIEETVKRLLGETLDSTLSGRERDYVDVVAFMQDTGFSHHAMFGTPLNMRELTSHPKLGRPVAGQPNRVFSLQDAYDEKYGTQVAEKQKAAHDKVIEDEVQKRLAEERKKFGGHPFPLRDSVQPSVLDTLATKEGSAVHTLDSAVEAYEALQAGRGQ